MGLWTTCSESLSSLFVLPSLRINFIIFADPTPNGEGTPISTPHSVLSTPLCCTWRCPCAWMKMWASTNFTMAVRLYFRHRRVCCEQRELHWVHARWVYELAGQLRVYLYEWIHWRRIQLHRCVSAFLFNINKYIYNESYVCKLQNNCSCLPRKQDPPSDRTRKEWRPKRKLQINRRDSDKEGGLAIKSRISEYWCTKHANTNNRFIGALWTSRRHWLYLPW